MNWGSTYKCVRKSDHHYEKVVHSERDPRLWPILAPNCAMCGKVMTLAQVENLTGIDYSRKRTRAQKKGFKAEQRELF